MNMAVTGAFGRGHFAHARPVNFGQLNSAITRGDLSAAQDAFTAINDSSAPATKAAKARGPLEIVGSAIAAGNIEGARMLLANFRAGRVVPTEPVPQSEGLEAANFATEPIPALNNTLLPDETTATEQIVALLSGLGSTIEVPA
jgi:hypothetical protein